MFLICLFVYLIGSFGNASLDLTKWNPEGRVFITVVMGIISLVAIPIVYKSDF